MGRWLIKCTHLILTHYTTKLHRTSLPFMVLLRAMFYSAAFNNHISTVPEDDHPSHSDHSLPAPEKIKMEFKNISRE